MPIKSQQQFTDAVRAVLNEQVEPGALVFKPDATALAQLAQGTSVVIASLLAIPDGFALIPNATSAVGWALRLIGIWIIAAVLWFVGFLGILHCVSLLVRGVEVGPTGIRLWRFGRLLKWEQVEGMAVEEQEFFTRLFSLRSMARRLTIFEGKKARSGALKLLPHYLPSFFFRPPDFEQLCQAICQRRFDLSPSTINVFVSTDNARGSFKRMFKHAQWSRIAVSILIGFCLVSWLGRKAAVNYMYNSGIKALDHQDLGEAKRRFQWALSIEPTAAYAWYDLARVEFRLGEIQAAQKHWRKALFYKPDYVDAMTGLARIALESGDYKSAGALIDNALSLAPLYPFALVNRADYEMLTGHTRQSMDDARLAMVQAAGKNEDVTVPATCILAQDKLRLGDTVGAERVLVNLPPLAGNQALWRANPRRLMVVGQLKLAQGKFKEAVPLLQAALQGDNSNEETLLSLAHAYTETGQPELAQPIIARAMALRPNSCRPYIMAARLDLTRGDAERASSDLAHASDMPSVDANSLSQIASLYMRLGKSADAIDTARRALAMDSSEAPARQLIRASGENRQ